MIEITDTGLVVGPDTARSEWASFGKQIQRRTVGIYFAMGDWLNYGLEHFDQEVRLSASVLLVSPGTAALYAWLASRVPRDVRNPRLNVGHHMAVAKLTPTKQALWLARAIQNGWSKSELSRRVNGLESAGKGYATLIVDCQNESVLETVTSYLSGLGVEWKRPSRRSRRAAA